MPRRCCDVVYTLLIILFFEANSSTKSIPVCPVRPLSAESGWQGDCQCSVLDEIHCRGLAAVPEIDLKASYTDRRTYRALYLARQQIHRLPAAAFAALNVRRIVLDFNPIGDRINAQAFRGAVDAVELARLGLVSRRRRTSYYTTGRNDGLAGSRQRRRSNDEIESRQLEIVTTDPTQKYSGTRRRHRETAPGQHWNFSVNATYDETGSGQAKVEVADQSRRYG